MKKLTLTLALFASFALTLNLSAARVETANERTHLPALATAAKAHKDKRDKNVVAKKGTVKRQYPKVDKVAFWQTVSKLLKNNGYDENSGFYRHAQKNLHRVETRAKRFGKFGGEKHRGGFGFRKNQGKKAKTAATKTEDKKKLGRKGRNKKADKQNLNKDTKRTTRKHTAKKDQYNKQ